MLDLLQSPHPNETILESGRVFLTWPLNTILLSPLSESFDYLLPFLCSYLRIDLLFLVLRLIDCPLDVFRNLIITWRDLFLL